MCLQKDGSSDPVLFVRTIAGILVAVDMAQQARFATMPALFPGIDPYLEGSSWTTFHFAFAAVYDLLGYDLAIGYTQPPDIPLAGEAALLTETILRSAGLPPA